MMLQKKLERAMNWLNKKNSPDIDYSENNEENLELEKNDILALIISTLIVFGPIILVLIIILRWTF